LFDGVTGGDFGELDEGLGCVILPDIEQGVSGGELMLERAANVGGKCSPLVTQNGAGLGAGAVLGRHRGGESDHLGLEFVDSGEQAGVDLAEDLDA